MIEKDMAPQYNNALSRVDNPLSTLSGIAIRAMGNNLIPAVISGILVHIYSSSIYTSLFNGRTCSLSVLHTHNMQRIREILFSNYA